jgi:hypothetical protein
MKYKQVGIYQNINGNVGRDCNERWKIINNYTNEPQHNLSIDVGSAEGFFVKKLSESNIKNVVSVEGTIETYNIQKRYCLDEISSGNVNLVNLAITEQSVGLFTNKSYDVCLLLAVLHWCDNPDLILKELSNVSNYTFIEIPDLDDKVSYGQDYLKRISDVFGTVKNYIEVITGKSVIDEYRVGALTTNQRSLFVVK